MGITVMKDASLSSRPPPPTPLRPQLSSSPGPDPNANCCSNSRDLEMSSDYRQTLQEHINLPALNARCFRARSLPILAK